MNSMPRMHVLNIVTNYYRQKDCAHDHVIILYTAADTRGKDCAAMKITINSARENILRKFLKK